LATVIGEAGGTALRKAIVRAAALPAMVLIFVVALLPLTLVAIGSSDNPRFLVGCVVLAVGVALWWTRRDWMDAYEFLIESRDWARGAAGERKAANDLGALPQEYLVLNDVHPGFRGPNASWNWDHVVIGPRGLFVVDAKNYSALRIADGASDGRTRRNVRQVRSYAIAFKRELVRLNPSLQSLFVVPMLAYVNESAWVEKLREGDVRVLPLRLLRNDILTGPPSCLSTNEAVKIANSLFSMYELHQQEAFRAAFTQWGQYVRAHPWGVVVDEPAASRADAPACPVCGASMKRRDGKYGPFFGCSMYRTSGCTGKRALDGAVK